jgi:hypothetical protein
MYCFVMSWVAVHHCKAAHYPHILFLSILYLPHPLYDIPFPLQIWTHSSRRTNVFLLSRWYYILTGKDLIACGGQSQRAMTHCPCMPDMPSASTYWMMPLTIWTMYLIILQTSGVDALCREFVLLPVRNFLHLTHTVILKQLPRWVYVITDPFAFCSQWYTHLISSLIIFSSAVMVIIFLAE